MKKSIVLFALILLCAGALMAQQSISVAPYISIYSNTEKDTFGGTTTTDKEDSFNFGVSVPIVLDSGMEVAPYLGVQANVKGADDKRNTFLKLGSGIFWPMFGNSIFTLKTGPDANLFIKTGFSGLPSGRKASYFELGVSVPLILDIKLNDRFSVRVRQYIVGMTLISDSWKDDSDNKSSDTTFRFNSFPASFGPTFAFVIKVK